VPAETLGQDHEIAISDQELHERKLATDHFRVAALLLHTRGYVILNRAIPVAVAHAGRDAFHRIYRDCLASKQGEGWYQVARQTQAVFWERNCRWRIFPKLSPPFDSPWLVANPFVRELLQFLLGDGWYCKFVSIDTCAKGALLQAPHRELGVGQSWEPRCYIVNVPLGRCGLDNGPLEIWPGGSHLWRNALLDQLGMKTDVQDGQNLDCEWFSRFFPSRKVVLEPGDLLIRDPGMMHRGTVNHTDEPRSMLTVCYFRRGQTHDYGQLAYNLDRGLWDQLDPDIKHLFAHAFEPAGPKDESQSSAAEALQAPVRKAGGLWPRIRLRWQKRKSA
jgi:hypothetical protein